jgi:hypothetical protein
MACDAADQMFWQPRNRLLRRHTTHNDGAHMAAKCLQSVVLLTMYNQLAMLP